MFSFVFGSRNNLLGFFFLLDCNYYLLAACNCLFTRVCVCVNVLICVLLKCLNVLFRGGCFWLLVVAG